ncbi:hypothetical protein BD408DRAFT_356420 [Parasitella parasitica]|nr:hypothetical protein BD408DRAFT_356420 [Parasitella parasitica]
MHRLIGAALLLDKIKIALIETYRANSTLLKLEHFVSLAIVYMGICSRLYKLCHIWVNQIEECYHMLYIWSTCFPSGLKNKEQKTFNDQHNLQCSSDTLKSARIEFAQNTLKLKSSVQHKVHLETYLANQSVVDKINTIQKEHEINNFSDLEDIGQETMDFEDLGGSVYISYFFLLSMN